MHDSRFSLPYGGNVNGMCPNNMKMTLYCDNTASLLAGQETTCRSEADDFRSDTMSRYVQVVIPYLMAIASFIRTT